MTLHFEDVQIGQALPPFTRTTTMENWNRFAAVNDEFVDLHMDPDRAKEWGEKDVFGMGNLRLSYLHCLLREWAGDVGYVRRIAIQHRSINYKNDTLTSKGVVEDTRVENGQHLVDVALWVENQHGERIDTAKATVVLPSSRPRNSE